MGLQVEVSVGSTIGRKFLVAFQFAGLNGFGSWVGRVGYNNKNGDAGEVNQ